MLCEKCQKVRPAWHNGFRERCLIKHHDCLDDLIQSAYKGCRLCELFRPYAQRYKRRDPNQRDDTNEHGFSDHFAWTREDPFDNEAKISYKVDSGFSYVDRGSHYHLHGVNKSRDEIEPKRKEIERDNPFHEPNPREGPIWHRNHFWDHHEIFRWLFTVDELDTGPEQVWLLCEYKHGSTDSYKGQRESSHTFQLCAGSIPIGGDFKCCFEGEDISNTQQLALRFPSLWKWRAINLSGSKFRSGYPKFEFCIEDNVLFAQWSDITARPIQNHAGSTATFNILRKWLHLCNSTHFRCHNMVNSNPPSRLIDVGTSAASDTLYLRDSVEFGTSRDTRYAILSHCWGSTLAKSTCLNCGNIDSMKKGIDWDNLATNFQDAIIITRALGIQYLWIDALCILQDSASDWASEASRMADYYSGSEICIATTAAAHAYEGLLRPRPIEYVPVRLEGGNGGLMVQKVAEDVSSIIEYIRFRAWRLPIAKQPLSTRAWTLQERLFARRIIHYTEQQMIWQCHTSLIGEDGQVGEEMDKGLDKVLGGKKQPFDLTVSEPLREITGGNENELGRNVDLVLSAPVKGHTGVKYSLDEALWDTSWYKLLEEYTRRSLSCSSDMLPAISAIASEIQKLTRAEYRAGLWIMNNEIPIRSILWYKQKPDMREKNGSPSWSWSSVTGATSHPSIDMIRFDHPGAIVEWIPVPEKSDPEPKPESHQNKSKVKLRQVSRSVLNIRYDHKNSQLDIHQCEAVPVELSAPFGQVNQAYLHITGLVHKYTGAKEYKFEAENQNLTNSSQMARGDFKLEEYLDVEDPNSIQWDDGIYLLMFVAEFRDHADGHGIPGRPNNDNRQFLILKKVPYGSEVNNLGEEYERVGILKLTNRTQHGSLTPLRCAYIEENGWYRREMILV